MFLRVVDYYKVVIVFPCLPCALGICNQIGNFKSATRSSQAISLSSANWQCEVQFDGGFYVQPWQDDRKRGAFLICDVKYVGLAV